MRVSARGADMGNEDHSPRRRPVVKYDARLAFDRPAYARSRERAQAQREENDARRAELLQRMGKKDTRQSLVDLEAAYRGTNASQGSEEFDRAFARDADGKPMGNKPDAWTRRFENKGQNEAQLAGAGANARATGKTGETRQEPAPQNPEGSGVVLLARNEQGTASRGDGAPATGTRGVGPQRVPVATSRMVPEAESDALFGRVETRANAAGRQAAATPGTTAAAPSIYGQGSVRYDRGAGDDVKKLAPTSVVMDQDGKTPIGLNRATPREALPWQQRVVEDFPEIGQKGTQANAEFVRAYQQAERTQNGERDPYVIAQSVTKNISNPPKVAKLPANFGGQQGAQAFGAEAPGSLLRTGVQPTAGVEMPQFAGNAAPESDWVNMSPPSLASEAGKMVNRGGKALAKGFVKGTKDTLLPPVKAVTDFARSALGFDAEPEKPPIVSTVENRSFPLTDPERRKSQEPFGKASAGLSLQGGNSPKRSTYGGSEGGDSGGGSAMEPKRYLPEPEPLSEEL